MYEQACQKAEGESGPLESHERELRNAVEAYLAISALPRGALKEDTGLEAAPGRFVDPTQSYDTGAQ